MKNTSKSLHQAKDMQQSLLAYIHNYQTQFLAQPFPVFSNRMLTMQTHSSRTAFRTEAKTALLLVDRDHSTTFRRINSLYHGYHLVHLGPLVGIRVPAPFHHVCKGARAASR